MVVKKNNLGIKTVALLLFLLLNLFVFCTSSFARQTLTDEEVNYIVDNSLTYDPSQNLYNNLWFYNNITYRPPFELDTSSLKNVFKEAFNSNNQLNFEEDLQDFFGYWGGYIDNDNYIFRFYYTNQINYGKFDGYNHVYFLFDNKIDNRYIFSIRFIDDNKNIVSVPFKCLEFKKPISDDFIFSRFYETSSAINSARTDLEFKGPSDWNINNINNSKLDNINGIINFFSTNSVFTNFDGENFYNEPITKLFISNYYETTEPENPENPEDSEEPENGDETQKVDLSGIENGIGNINQNIEQTNEKLDGISGELGNLNNSVNDLNNNLTNVPNLSGENLTSGEIIGSLNFDFMEDPYSNFWLELTTGLGSALTNNIRTLDINWLGYVHTINLDTIGLKYPASMELILKSTSTVAIVWILVKWWKIIIDKLSSGNMDEVLAMNEEERYC